MLHEYTGRFIVIAGLDDGTLSRHRSRGAARKSLERLTPARVTMRYSDLRAVDLETGVVAMPGMEGWSVMEPAASLARLRDASDDYQRERARTRAAELADALPTDVARRQRSTPVEALRAK